MDTNKVELSEDQMIMLRLSDEDVENGNLISQVELDIRDLKWLKSFF